MTTKIDYNKIANGIIARFDGEISGGDYQFVFNLMNKREKDIFTLIEFKMIDKLVLITTRESREIKRQRSRLDTLFV